MTAQPMPERRDTAAILASVRDHGQTITDAEIDRIRDVVAWAEQNLVDDEADAATIIEGHFETGIPIAGPGAPLVSEFGLMELIAVLGRTPDSGRIWVGSILELAWRLPDIYEGVKTGRVPVWKALRIADLTKPLTPDAAAHVNQHLATFAATCTWAQIDRLVAEAIARFDPSAAAERAKEAAERRHFTVETDHAFDGTIAIHGQLDTADALDLEAAVARRAAHLGDLGCEDPLDVRRAKAVGELARADQMLDLTTETEDGTTRTRPGRKVDLHVHLSEAALSGADNVGRLGNTRTPVDVDQIREWCGTAGTLIVRPVIDLAGHEPLEAYEIPDRHRRQVQLRDPHCVFPHCGKPAARCDLDHARPWAESGPTCPCNLVPACRRHHRAKTHSAWRYVVLDPGSYLWTSPHGHQFHVDHTGTRHLDAPRRCPAVASPDE